MSTDARVIKPIETSYSGYRFRSRLEARWAVYFDAMGIRWDYEVEGFDLGKFGYYLPDFYLPDAGFWVEVKPGVPSLEALRKANRLMVQSLKGVIILDGVPEDRAYYFLCECGWKNPWYSESEITVSDLFLCYYKEPGRFYVSTGGDNTYPGSATHNGFPEVRKGVNAARSARFEHMGPHS